MILKFFIVDQNNVFGNCVKVNKTERGWSPWSSSL